VLTLRRASCHSPVERRQGRKVSCPSPHVQRVPPGSNAVAEYN
jgi:hypothetical protein